MYTSDDFPSEKLGKRVRIVIKHKGNINGALVVEGRFTHIATKKVYIDPSELIVGDWVYFDEIESLTWKEYTSKDFPMSRLGKVLSIRMYDGSLIRGNFMAYKPNPDRIYIAVLDHVPHEFHALKDIESVVWE